MIAKDIPSRLPTTHEQADENVTRVTMSVPVCARRSSPHSVGCCVRGNGESAQEARLSRNELDRPTGLDRRSCRAKSVRSRTRLSAAAVKVRIQSTSSPPCAARRRAIDPDSCYWSRQTDHRTPAPPCRCHRIHRTSPASPPLRLWPVG